MASVATTETHTHRHTQKFASVAKTDTPTPTNTTPTYSAGLAGIIAGESSISTCGLVGHKGLTYRGYDINDLAAKCCFEEVAYLLLYGELPTQSELNEYKDTLCSYRQLPQTVLDILEKLPASAHPMDVLRTGVSVLGVLEPEVSPKSQVQITNRLIGCYSSMLLYWYHFSKNGTRISVHTNPKDSVAEHFYKLLHNDPNLQIDPVKLRALDVSLILYCEHDFNASTFAARVTAATLSDVYSAICSAIGTLRGNLHGGANEAAMNLLLDFDSVRDAEQKLTKAIEQKQIIMGFGHRLYKTGDPRSPLIKEHAAKLAQQPYGDPKLFEISQFVEQFMLEKKRMYPNLDFYSASTYFQCGIPVDFFTPLFVLARTTGWSAHIGEQRSKNRLIRPQSAYTGPEDKAFVEISKRVASKL